MKFEQETTAITKASAETTTLAKANPYEPRNHDEAWRLAQIVSGSALYKLGGSPEAAYVILMTGRDLGLSQSQALRGVKIVNGAPAPSADTLVAVCLNSGLCEYFEEVETTENASTWATKRKGRPEKRYTYTIEEAKAAGVFARKESPWTTYPKRMLAARAKAFLARDVFPDVTLGLFTPEELIEQTPTPVAIASVAQWQAAVPEAEVVEEPAQDWRAQIKAAETKEAAIAIGREVSAKDPTLRDEALALVKEAWK